jgi:RNase H-like domain found in reverse transcriptase
MLAKQFQHFMDIILVDLPCCFIYIDNLLVASVSHEQHVEDLCQVLDKCQQHGLALNMDKCLFGIVKQQAICKAAELAHPRLYSMLFLALDASNTHVDAAGSGWKLAVATGIFSAKLLLAQTKYSAFDHELLACYLAIRHFRWQLEGVAFYILSSCGGIWHSIGAT